MKELLLAAPLSFRLLCHHLLYLSYFPQFAHFGAIKFCSLFLIIQREHVRSGSPLTESISSVFSLNWDNLSARSPEAVMRFHVRPHPACSCSTAGWRCSGEHEAGPPGRAPSGRCSGWPPTGPATARGACSPPAPARRTGEGSQRGEEKRHQPGTEASFFDYLNVPHCPKQGPWERQRQLCLDLKPSGKKTSLWMTFQRSGSWVIGGSKGGGN